MDRNPIFGTLSPLSLMLWLEKENGLKSPNHSDRANSTSVSSSNSTASMNTATQVLEPHYYWPNCRQPKYNLCVSFYIQSIFPLIALFCCCRLKSWGQSLWAAVPTGQQQHHQGMIHKPSSGIHPFVYYFGKPMLNQCKVYWLMFKFVAFQSLTLQANI